VIVGTYSKFKYTDVKAEKALEIIYILVKYSSLKLLFIYIKDILEILISFN